MTHPQSAFTAVKSVLVVLSSRAMLFDPSGLRNLISHAYPGAAVFFISTSGDPVGVEGPRNVDLILDFTEPGARQGFWFAFRLRGRGTHVVGRSGAYFRKRYDRLLNEKTDDSLPKDYLERERIIQRKMLELAGIQVVKQGGLTQDRSKDIASQLPPLQNR
ncbi:MAG: hypothetical protein H7333_08165 [Bdellovibrionales bacterium]|nr:hypothetical protein [Oligoflexia bacterium]